MGFLLSRKRCGHCWPASCVCPCCEGPDGPALGGPSEPAPSSSIKQTKQKKNTRTHTRPFLAPALSHLALITGRMFLRGHREVTRGLSTGNRLPLSHGGSCPGPCGLSPVLVLWAAASPGTLINGPQDQGPLPSLPRAGSTQKASAPPPKVSHLHPLLRGVGGLGGVVALGPVMFASPAARFPAHTEGWGAPSPGGRSPSCSWPENRAGFVRAPGPPQRGPGGEAAFPGPLGPAGGTSVLQRAGRGSAQIFVEGG